MANILITPGDTEPKRIAAGSSALWQRADLGADYPSGGGFALSYRFAPTKGGTVSEVEATAGPDGWRIELPITITADWAAGAWRWMAVVAKDDQRVIVDQGELIVDPDPFGETAQDLRSHAERTLALIEATIEGRATSADLKYTFEDGRSIERMTHADLIAARTKYAAIVAAEKRKAAGRGPGRLKMRL